MILSAFLTIPLACHAFGGSAVPGLFAENIGARLYRSALAGLPSLNSSGWPQYTQGAHNNTPASDTEPGRYVGNDASGWTAGFFPDSLWQLYRRRTKLGPKRSGYDQEPGLGEWLELATAWTNPLISNEDLTNTHDLGFLAKPFESALNVAGQTKWLPVLAKMSNNLAHRYVPAAGIIRSWDTNNASFSQRGSHEDSVLVIIDNMMNLALLAHSAARYTKNETLLEIAISHANKTRDHHMRPDGSSFHVCDYSGATGEVYLCRTAQGLADDSTWARGQAWAISGFAEMYGFTRDDSYLKTSLKAADWFLKHLPHDGVPFWDFNAPFIPNVTPRDSSAATIAASGMILLQQEIEKGRSGARHWRGGHHGRYNYRKAAVKLLRDTLALTLAGEISFSSIDFSDPGSNLGAVTNVATPANTELSRGFESVLMHATANNNPNAGSGRSYDSGLVYGDFYLIEAGNRLLEEQRNGKPGGWHVL